VTLTAAASLATDGEGFCEVLTSGGVNCWGYAKNGELGNGKFYRSAFPVQVVGVGGTGTLTGVASVTSDGDGFCALRTSGGIDCWGYDYYGELGNGEFHRSKPYGSAVPVQVDGVDGVAILTGVATLTSDGRSDCALLNSGGVDCWGDGYNGQLGNGQFYTTGNERSAVPVEVEGIGGTGILTEVARLTNAGDGFCALLTSGGVDCWGDGYNGQLGNGQSSNEATSAVPVQVEGVGGVGSLGGVANLTGDGLGDCALLTSGEVDRWGYGAVGELGNGKFYPSGSPVPVKVK
jgi:alpha-tubulin suppressor-like RCC1 family protein